jgi:PglZ domain
MGKTLQQHIYEEIARVLQKEAAWMVWCDPRGDWGPLLQRVANAPNTQGFVLESVSERTANEIGSLVWRKRVQERIARKEPFVLHIKAAKNELGWLWGQALLAEKTYDKTLQNQLLEWGWRPQNIRTSEDELARLARQNLQQDPIEWGGGKVVAKPMLLLDILAGSANTLSGNAEERDEDAQKDERVVLDLTIEEAGLPPLDEENLERWRTNALARLLVTQAHKQAAGILEQHEFLIPAVKQAFALDLLDKWLDSVKLSRVLPERILEADLMLGLGNYFSEVPIERGPFLSQAIERALFASACAQLVGKSGRELLEGLIALRDIAETHAGYFWGDRHATAHTQALPWGELARLGQAAKLLLAAAPRSPWSHLNDAIAWYSKTGWQVERAGEEILQHLSKPNLDLLNIITPIRNAFYARWEDYMLQWTELWMQAGCPQLELSTQGKWLAEQLKGTRATAVLVIDALRYDIGMGLKEMVNRREGVERAQVFPARTALPTITALGMGVALPLDESELHAELVKGKWELYQKGHESSGENLSIAENRREWLRKHMKVAPEAMLNIKDSEAGKIPAPQGRQPRLFIFDNILDKLGHDEELEMMGSEEVQKRYLRAIEQLQDKGWQRILIVTDHGFIYWSGYHESRVPFPRLDPEYISRRALAYPASTQISGPQALAPGGKWRVAFSSGAACFRTYGGLGYFHGGASLQEWVIPCIKIEWPSKARPVDIAIQPIAQILSLRPKITLDVLKEHLFASEDTLARQIEVSMREQKQKTILFEAPTTLVTPERDTITVQLEAVEGVEAERNTKMVIEVRDARTGKIIASEITTLMVAIENW